MSESSCSSAQATTVVPTWPQGMKRTRTRESVWAALQSTDKPVTALALFEEIRLSDTSAWLSTVYRALEAFVASGSVARSVPTDSTQAVYELKRHVHRHYAVCLTCHALIPIDVCPLENMLSAVTPKDFCVEGHSLELYGLCGDCHRKA